ncbi:hypothetical protein PMAYCL1PPCAC_10180, partial [Pristionchus mayeri]
TMPQLIMDKIAACILSDSPSYDEFEDLNDLRMVNRACFKAVESFLRVRTNLPQLDSITFTEMEFDRTSFALEIRMPAESVRFHLALKELRRRLISIKRTWNGINWIICLTIPVRNRKDAVIEYLPKAISPVVRNVCVGSLRSLEELKLISKMMEKTKIQSIAIKLDSYCRINDELSAELISTIGRHNVAEFHIDLPGQHATKADPGENKIRSVLSIYISAQSLTR